VPSLQERLDVLSGAAHDEGHGATTGNLPDCCARQTQELCQPNRFIGVCDVDEMVWNATQFLRRRLCGSDGHPAVELARVRRDDLSAELLRKGDTERCLSNRRGPNDRDQGGEDLVSGHSGESTTDGRESE